MDSPVTVEDDDRIGRLQVDSESSCTRRKEEDKVGRPRSIEVLDSLATSLGGDCSVKSLVEVSSDGAVIRENVPGIELASATSPRGERRGFGLTAFGPSD